MQSGKEKHNNNTLQSIYHSYFHSVMTYGLTFRDMNILLLRSQYIYSLMTFVIKNREIFDTNRDCYEIDTRQNMNIHMYQVNLAKYGNGVYH
jgi:hypothetical protein